MRLVEQVIPGLWRIRFPTANSNAYLIEHHARLAFVDCGTPGTVSRLRRAVAATGFAPGDVGDVLVTHYHWDHVGNLAPLAAAGMRVWIHSGDAAVVRTGEPRPPGIPRDPLAKAIIVISKPVARDPTEPVEIHREITDGEVVPVAGGARIVHLPGHTSGHVGILMEESGFFFAGDAIRHDLRRVGYSVTHEDEALGQASIGRIAELDFDVCLFGHGPAIVGSASARLKLHLRALALRGPRKDGRG